MDDYRYPALFINHEALRHNVSWVSKNCEENGILFCGVIKGANGLRSEIQDFAKGGCKMLATSRLEQLRRCKEVDPVIADGENKGKKIPLMLIRVPMLSEVKDVIELADYSLNSELSVLEALNEEARKQDKLHKVVLMVDLGDLREGWFDKDEFVRAACYVENELNSLILAGIGTNLGCVGSVVPDEDKMIQLAELAERVEEAIERELEIVSGGATSSLAPMFEGVMPKKVNMLRIGGLNLDGPLDPTAIDVGIPNREELREDTFTLKAEVIEVKNKPSHPIGRLGVDAFGKRREYVDKGIRKRALIAIGRQDYGDPEDLIPIMDGIEIWGASSDHTVLDIEDCKKEIAVGDIIEFKLTYSAILRLTMNEYVHVYDI